MLKGGSRRVDLYFYLVGSAAFINLSACLGLCSSFVRFNVLKSRYFVSLSVVANGGFLVFPFFVCSSTFGVSFFARSLFGRSLSVGGAGEPMLSVPL